MSTLRCPDRRLPPDDLPVTFAPIPPVGAVASPVRDAAGFVCRLVFFAVAPLFFVITAMMINAPFLLALLLLTFLLASVMSRPDQLLAFCPWLQRIAVLGDGLKTLSAIHDFYQHHPARTFAYYVFYPVSAPIAAFRSPASRKESRLYLGILGTIFGAIVVESVLSYRAVFPPHLNIGDALVWGTVRVIFAFLLVLGLLVPVAATTYSYRRAGKKWRLRALAWTGLASALLAVISFYAISRAKISFLSSEHLALRLQRRTFRAALREPTEMFLMHHARRMHLTSAGTPSPSELTARYRLLIGKLAVEDEALAFDVFTFPLPDEEPWLGVRVTFNENNSYPPQWIALAHPDLGFVTTWGSLPSTIQAHLHADALRSDPELPSPEPRLLDDLP